MGRLKKVFEQDILDHLVENGVVTIKDLANTFEVTPDTIRIRLRELRKDGEKIIGSRNGVQVVFDKQELQDIETANNLEDHISRTLGVLDGLNIAMPQLRPLLPQMKRTLATRYTPEERRMLAESVNRIAVFITHSIAAEEIL